MARRHCPDVLTYGDGAALVRLYRKSTVAGLGRSLQARRNLHGLGTLSLPLSQIATDGVEASRRKVGLCRARFGRELFAELEQVRVRQEERGRLEVVREAASAVASPARSAASVSPRSRGHLAEADRARRVSSALKAIGDF